MGNEHHHHEHANVGTATGRQRWRLGIVAAMSFAAMAAEVVGGLLSGSLALLTDAGHLLTDSMGLLIALLAASLAMCPPTARRTYGWQRAEVLAALANGVMLMVIAITVAVHAVERWGQPAEVEPGLMLAVAAGGLVVNVVGLVVLHGGRKESLNLRGAYLEVLSDSIGSAAVILAAILIGLTGWAWIDSLAALLLFAMIVPRAWSLIRAAAEVLLETTPPGVDLNNVHHHLEGLPGVVEVHDLHAWTITSGMKAMSAHVVVDDAVLAGGDTCGLLDQMAGCLDNHFEIAHSTFQLEPVEHRSQGLCVH